MIAEGEEALAAGDPEVGGREIHGRTRPWRGSPLADFTFEPFAQSEIARLEERKLIAEEGVSMRSLNWDGRRSSSPRSSG